GIGKGCVKVEDFEKADGIFILGQNPGTNHPRMMTTLERAKKNGATIVAINPMPEPGLMAVVNPNPQEYRNPFAYAAKMLFNKGTPLSDLWLPVRINGDMAAMRGIMKAMLAEEELGADERFVPCKTWPRISSCTAARTRMRHSRTDQANARRQNPRLFWHGREFPGCLTRYRIHRKGIAKLPCYGACPYEIKAR